MFNQTLLSIGFQKLSSFSVFDANFELINFYLEIKPVSKINNVEISKIRILNRSKNA